MKDRIDQWAFLWSRRLLEEIIIRPDFDARRILSLLNEDELADCLPEGKLQLLSNNNSDRMDLNRDVMNLNSALTN